MDWQRKFGASAFCKELMDCVVNFTAQTGETVNKEMELFKEGIRFCPKQNRPRNFFDPEYRIT
jgi:hypothetical protein